MWRRGSGTLLMGLRPRELLRPAARPLADAPAQMPSRCSRQKIPWGSRKCAPSALGGMVRRSTAWVEANEWGLEGSCHRILQGTSGVLKVEGHSCAGEGRGRSCELVVVCGSRACRLGPPSLQGLHVRYSRVSTVEYGAHPRREYCGVLRDPIRLSVACAIASGHSTGAAAHRGVPHRCCHSGRVGSSVVPTTPSRCRRRRRLRSTASVYRTSAR